MTQLGLAASLVEFQSASPNLLPFMVAPASMIALAANRVEEQEMLKCDIIVVVQWGRGTRDAKCGIIVVVLKCHVSIQLNRKSLS